MRLVRFAERPDLLKIQNELRVGGRIVAAAPESMFIQASDWEEWTEMRFPADGTYVFPETLAPLVVADGVGTHVEPNVWLRHSS